MALIKCPECGREVSDKATACPHCGCPVELAQPVGGTAGPVTNADRPAETRRPQAPAAKAAPASKKVRRIILLVLAAVIIAAGIFVLTTKNAQEAKLKPYKTVGSVVTFGTYPQTEAGTDKTPIEWIVLDVQGSKALLLSKYGLAGKPFHTRYEDTTWEKCTLRTWLNEDFVRRAFSESEAGAVLVTEVDNGKSQGYSGWDTSGGILPTKDKVFLLSYEEAKRYMDVHYYTEKGADQNVKSRVSPTPYAKKRGAWVDEEQKTEDGTGAGWWWLRSPGNCLSYAAQVYSDGSLSLSHVSSTRELVRPALWLDLNAI